MNEMDESDGLEDALDNDHYDGVDTINNLLNAEPTGYVDVFEKDKKTKGRKFKPKNPYKKDKNLRSTLKDESYITYDL